VRKVPAASRLSLVLASTIAIVGVAADWRLVARFVEADASEGFVYVDTLLRHPVATTPPIYDHEAILWCTPGTVLVHVRLDAKGHVIRASLARELNRWNCRDSVIAESVDAACVAAVRSWRFQPKTRLDQRDTCTVLVEYPARSDYPRLYGTLVGRATCRKPGGVIRYGIVEILGTRHGGTTDSDGAFRVDTVPAGQWRVRVRSVDCLSGEADVTITAGAVDSLEINLGTARPEGPK
jgi:hypothetical protein